MDQPTTQIKIIGYPVKRADNGEADPLIDTVRIVTVVNSTPAINGALREFVKDFRGYGIEFAKVQFRAVR